ncbi:MAG: hypothetical protein HY843_06105 [Bdellovibrio sp.]|nr:hypothetical protein [Bdellovibrio sp.]
MMSENLDTTADIAMLATFLGDDEFRTLSKNEQFRRHIRGQKKVLASLLKNSYELTNGQNGRDYFGQNTKPVAVLPLKIKPENKPDQIKKSYDKKALLKEVTLLFSEKTGYPEEMLESNLDLEADLGIDTVKQMEILGMIRLKYQLELKEGFSLKQTPSLQTVADMIYAQLK